MSNANAHASTFGRDDVLKFTGSGLQDYFLVATPQLRDPYFSHSVTYICEHTVSGAMGIVINHPLSLNLHDMFQHLNIKEKSNHSQQPVVSGGPIQIDRGFVLHKNTNNHRWESTLPISADICLTTSKDIIKDIAIDEGPDSSLVALGFASWAPGQLERELKSNSWLAVPADTDIVFNTPHNRMAQAAAKKIGIDLSQLAPGVSVVQ